MRSTMSYDRVSVRLDDSYFFHLIGSFEHYAIATTLRIQGDLTATLYFASKTPYIELLTCLQFVSDKKLSIKCRGSWLIYNIVQGLAHKSAIRTSWLIAVRWKNLRLEDCNCRSFGSKQVIEGFTYPLYTPIS